MGDRDVATPSRSAADNGARDASGNAASDALGLNRDCTPPRRGGDADNADADGRGAGSGEHGGRISAPTTAKPATLGWQSLLPGSIQ
ncbi:hypothetical protein IHE47_10895 [Rhodanobacter sp. DHB23]|nr:hypothetical protein [Rhodanobacter sp. DHB23]